MKQYSGMISIGILLLTYLIVDSFTGKVTGSLPYWVIGYGFALASFFSWYSDSGFWRKASATILIVIPTGLIAIVLTLIIGLWGSGF